MFIQQTHVFTPSTQWCEIPVQEAAWGKTSTINFLVLTIHTEAITDETVFTPLGHVNSSWLYPRCFLLNLNAKLCLRYLVNPHYLDVWNWYRIHNTMNTYESAAEDQRSPGPPTSRWRGMPVEVSLVKNLGFVTRSTPQPSWHTRTGRAMRTLWYQRPPHPWVPFTETHT